MIGKETYICRTDHVSGHRSPEGLPGDRLRGVGWASRALLRVAGRKTIFKKRGTSPDPALVSRDTTTASPMIGNGTKIGRVDPRGNLTIFRTETDGRLNLRSALLPKPDIPRPALDFCFWISPVPPARDDPCMQHCGKPERSCRI